MKLEHDIISQLGDLYIFGAGGYMGRFYVSALLELGIPVEKIVAIEVNSDRLMSVVEAFGLTRFYPELSRSIIEPRRRNCAIICVNTPAHLKVIEECYNAWLRRIFVEKPLVQSVKELEPLFSMSSLQLYTAYLINFSGIVRELHVMIRKNNWLVLQARAVWGKNWCSVNRPMGGDLEEEMPHPLALILSTISTNQKIDRVNSFAALTRIPFVQPHLLKEAEEIGVYYVNLNDSSLINLEVVDGSRTINAHLLSSFNMFEQLRRVEFSFTSDRNDLFPEYKACLDFDVRGADILRVKHAILEKTSEIMIKNENKLLIQLREALLAFAGNEPDSRLIGLEHSANLVRIIDEAGQQTNHIPD